LRHQWERRLKGNVCLFDVRRQICLRSGFSKFGCWDGNQKLDRSARSGAGMGIKNSTGSARSGAGMGIKNSTGQRDRVLGQDCQKLDRFSKIGCWDGNQKLDRSATSAGTDVKNSGCMRRVQGQKMSKTRDVCDKCRGCDARNLER
jgi:hypothetical protein